MSKDKPMKSPINNPFVDKSLRFKSSKSPEDLLARIAYLQHRLESAATATRLLVAQGEFPEQAENAVDDLVTELYTVYQAWATAIVLETTIEQFIPVTRAEIAKYKEKKSPTPEPTKDQTNE